MGDQRYGSTVWVLAVLSEEPDLVLSKHTAAHYSDSSFKGICHLLLASEATACKWCTHICKKNTPRPQSQLINFKVTLSQKTNKNIFFKKCLGQRDESVDKRACSQVWLPEFKPQDSHEERSTTASCPLLCMSSCGMHTSEQGDTACKLMNLNFLSQKMNFC